MDPDDVQESLRELLRVAKLVRSRSRILNQRLRIRDIYTLNYHLARKLSGGFPDARIMVGDRKGERGLVQHHWIEIPSIGAYVDPAADALDPFHPVRVGRITDEEFASAYLHGVDANIDVDDPRNDPRILFKTKSAFDSEA